MKKQAKIAEADEDYVDFIRDGHRCYISQTLRKEQFIIEGILAKELGSAIKRVLGGLRKRFVVIDFNKQVVRFKHNKSDAEYQVKKQIPFRQLLDAVIVTMDDHKQADFSYKILLQAMSRQYIFLAKTKLERQIWIEGLKNAIAIAKTPEIQQLNGTSMSLSTIGKKFQSDNLEVTPFVIKGQVMKRIEDQSIFHRQDFHQRFFKVEFGSPYCYFFQKESDSDWHKQHEQSQIRSCKFLSDEDIEKKFEEKKRENSKSLLRRMSSKSKLRMCKWNFGFSLEFPEKTYELYAPTRKEREKWVEVLSTIADMNSKSISLDAMSPLEFLAKKEADAQEAQRQQQQNQAADQPLSDREIFQNVHHWLKDNQEIMERHTLEEHPSYSSEQMHLNYNKVKGVCYLIQAFGSDLASTQDLRKVDEGKIKMTQVKLEANNQDSFLLMTNMATDLEESYLYDNMEEASISDFKVTSRALKLNRVNRTFTFNFKITFSPKIQLVFACASHADRYQWLRTLHLVLQMKNLGIDLRKINPFVFEYFRQEQLMIQSTADLKILKDVQPTDNNQEEEQKQQNIEQEQSKEQLEEHKQQDQQIFTPTISFVPSRYIEGYLVKAIETKRMLQITKHHFRFFRIIFSTGKLNIKEEKEHSQMRSFLLKDLISVKTVQSSHVQLVTKADWRVMQSPSIWERSAIIKAFPLKSDPPNWPYTFILEFKDRNFTLSARTKVEFEEWIRTFNLIIVMQKNGVSPTEKNPFLFSEEHGGLTLSLAGGQSNQIVNTYTIHTEEDQAQDRKNNPNDKNQSTLPGISILDNEENINFGVGSSNRIRETDEMDPVETRDLRVLRRQDHDRAQAIFQSIEEEKEVRSDQKNNEDDDSPKFNSFNPRIRRFKEAPNCENNLNDANNGSGDNPPEYSSSQGNQTVVNQNITVQNITIHNMNFANEQQTSQQSNQHNNQNNQNNQNNYTSGRAADDSASIPMSMPNRHDIQPIGIIRPDSAQQNRRSRDIKNKQLFHAASNGDMLPSSYSKSGKGKNYPLPFEQSAENSLEFLQLSGGTNGGISSVKKGTSSIKFIERQKVIAATASSQNSSLQNSQVVNLFSNQPHQQQPSQRPFTQLQQSSDQVTFLTTPYLENTEETTTTKYKKTKKSQKNKVLQEGADQESEMEHVKSRRSTRNKKIVRIRSSSKTGRTHGESDAEPSQIDTIQVFNNDLDSIPNDEDQVTSIQTSRKVVIQQEDQENKGSEAKPNEVTQIEDFVDVDIDDDYQTSPNINKSKSNTKQQNPSVVSPEVEWQSKVKKQLMHFTNKSAEGTIVMRNAYNPSTVEQSGATSLMSQRMNRAKTSLDIENKVKNKSQRGVGSPVKISLSKIRLNGSTEAFQSMEQVKKSVKRPKIIKIGANKPMDAAFNSDGKPSPLISLRSTRQIEHKQLINSPSSGQQQNTYGLPVKAVLNLKGVIRVPALKSIKSVKNLPNVNNNTSGSGTPNPDSDNLFRQQSAIAFSHQKYHPIKILSTKEKGTNRSTNFGALSNNNRNAANDDNDVDQDLEIGDL